ncbi:MAG: phosphatase domain-containing protein [Ferruginibacter sp.]
MIVETTSAVKKRSLSKRIKGVILKTFRLTNKPVVRLYTGYGNKTHCFLYGHVFSLSPLPRKKHRQDILLNALALLRLFMVKTKKAAVLQFIWEDKKLITISEGDGFFKFEWQPKLALTAGTHNVEVAMLDRVDGNIIATATAIIIVPHYNQFAFISDIDDTFLVSHSSNLRRRLFVLLTENALSRKPFDGVVNHYQLLSNAHAPEDTTNPFFYVSSSEWNLYNYIMDFSKKNKLPEGVYLLNQVKRFKQVFKTGQNNHGTKFMRITRVLEAYPEHRFVLLGDDSQADPVIYASAAEHFPAQIFGIYIRQVNKTSRPEVAEKLREIEKKGIYCCYFEHSAQAVIHSKSIGLIGELKPTLPQSKID